MCLVKQRTCSSMVKVMQVDFLVSIHTYPKKIIVSLSTEGGDRQENFLVLSSQIRPRLVSVGFIWIGEIIASNEYWIYHETVGI